MRIKDIKIQECNEPLVKLETACPDLIIRLNSKSAKRTCPAYLRKTVAKIICEAKEYLPKDMTFIIGDAWRPRTIQEEIHKSFMIRFTKKYPKWSEKQVLNEVNKYVAPFSGKYASGHMTGAAVDLRLAKNGRKVPMKSSGLTYQENAQSHQPKLPRHIKKNRKIMFDALSRAGLSNFPKEYWHWSYGDIWWAKRNSKNTAIYGVVEKY